MSNYDTDRAEVRRNVRQVIDDAESATWAECIETVATVTETPRDKVSSELDALEREGFVYRVSQQDDAEVRLP